MKKWFVPFLIILGLLYPGPAAAQEKISIASLEIDLWPEYDRPEMLVIYRIELSADVSLPVDLSLKIPVVAGEPNAVAVRDANGTLLNAPYERIIEGEWAIITLTATLPGIQFEYYDPQLLKQGSQRSFQYTWPGDYEVNSLVVQLQQPYGASQVTSIPASTSKSPGSDGLTYHTINLGSQSVGTSKNVQITYEKSDQALTIEGFQVQPSEPLSSNVPGRINIRNYLSWGLGILGLILLVGGVVWYWQMGSHKSSAKKRSRGKRSSRRERQPIGVEDSAIYCHECGKRAANGDRFCRSCGTKLRRN